MLFQVLTTTNSSPVPGVAETPMMLRVCALEKAWAISVALIENGQPRIGVLIAPARGESWVASAGGGATRNGLPLAASGQNGRLKSMISPKAEFGLGSGDVGNPLGKGVSGASSLSAAIKAQTYQYNGWDGIPGPSNACGEVQVEVTFVPSNPEREATVKFEYHNGVLTSAMGWLRSRNAGVVKVDAH